MKDERDPTRLAEASSTGALLRDALQRAADDGPDPARLARIAAALPLGAPGPGDGDGGPGDGGPGDGGPGLGTSTGATLGTSTGATLGTATGATLGTSTGATLGIATATKTIALASTGVALAAKAVPSLWSGIAVGAGLGLVTALGVWTVEDRPLSPPPTASPGQALSPSSTPSGPRRPHDSPAIAPPHSPAPHSLADSPGSGGGSARGNSAGGGGPGRPAAARSQGAGSPDSPAPAAGGAPAAAPGDATSSAPVPGDSPAPETEGELLARAQSELGKSPTTALLLTERHRATFPRPTMSQEREMIAISALLAAGRPAEARARAERLLAAHPGSAHQRRLRVLIPDL